MGAVLSTKNNLISQNIGGKRNSYFWLLLSGILGIRGQHWELYPNFLNNLPEKFNFVSLPEKYRSSEVESGWQFSSATILEISENSLFFRKFSSKGSRLREMKKETNRKKRRREDRNFCAQPPPRTLGFRAFVVFSVFAFNNATIFNSGVENRL